MAQQFLELNLLSSMQVMLSEQQPRTTIAPAAGETKAEYRPSIAYMHNVMPTKYGLNSVSYLPLVAAPAPAPASDFTDIKVIHGEARDRLYLGLTETGDTYILPEGGTVWVSVTSVFPISFDINLLTTGTVNGITYLYYRYVGAFTYSESGAVFTPVTLTGLDVGTLLGIVASSGYLIGYTDEAVAWSSTIDPTDFVPSQVTGSGGGKVAGIAGDILYITANTLGILVYANANVIAATFTGNVQYPFKFREAEGSKGGVSLDKTAYEANSTSQFAYTKAGLQEVTSRSASTFLPEVTDFLSGGRFEDYNEVTKDYEVTDLTATMLKKVKFVSSRYLVISYGITSYTHAIVVDIALSKLGKLRVDHVDMIDIVSTQTEVAKESIGVLLADGTVQVVDFSVTENSSGVLILGKLQYSSTRMIDLLGVEVENIEEGATFSVSSQVSLDGKTFTSVEGYLDYEADGLREYLFRSAAKNHSLVFTGRFNLVTALVRYAITGRR